MTNHESQIGMRTHSWIPEMKLPTLVSTGSSTWKNLFYWKEGLPLDYSVEEKATRIPNRRMIHQSSSFFGINLFAFNGWQQLIHIYSKGWALLLLATNRILVLCSALFPIPWVLPSRNSSRVPVLIRAHSHTPTPVTCSGNSQKARATASDWRAPRQTTDILTRPGKHSAIGTVIPEAEVDTGAFCS